jgi:hypothetical protein
MLQCQSRKDRQHRRRGKKKKRKIKSKYVIEEELMPGMMKKKYLSILIALL